MQIIKCSERRVNILLRCRSSNGKILAKVKNGRIVRMNIHTDLDESFRRAMSGNEMSADEEE